MLAQKKNYHDDLSARVTVSAADHLGQERRVGLARGPGVRTAVVGIACVLAVFGLLGLLFSFG